ncbi:thiol-disulfide oxidoreductase DCC family protein [Undibacterium sp. Ji22W]|uniref:thiol-disulfide oxidoreductase DCC family protein n=1 Tax=Undibacterium sp. Ji22W TaxID=3413038 RepID=UPI003BF2B3C4
MNDYPLTLLYDESCPLCKLEIDNLKARNDRNLLRFIDVSAEDFDDSQYLASKKEMMEIIHAIRPDGSIAKGVEVFRLAYGAVGLGWITAPTGLPLLKPLFDWAYVHVARNRYRLSNRFSAFLFKIAVDRAARRAQKQSQQCKDGACRIPTEKE